MEFTPLSSNAEGPLKEPFMVHLRGGMVQSIDVSDEEPTWCINIKKGIASQLSMNMGKVNPIPISSSSRRIDMNIVHRDSFADQQEREFYAVEEDSVSGKCRTYYTITPLPEYLARLHEHDMPLEVRSTVQGERPAFIVTKVKDFTSCKRKSYWMANSMLDSNPEPCNPSDNQCKLFSSRTSVSRYLIRGELDSYRLEKCWTEGEIVIRPYGSETEKIYTITNRTLTLLEVEPIKSNFHIPQLRRKEPLHFDFPEMNHDSPFKHNDPIYAVERDPTTGGLKVNEESVLSRDQELPRTYERRERSEFRRVYKRSLSEFEEIRPMNNYENLKREYESEPMHYLPREDARELWRTAELEVDSRIPSSEHRYIFPDTTFRTVRKIESREIKIQIEKLLHEVVEEIQNSENLARKETALKIVEISRAMTVLGFEELSEVYNEVLSNVVYPKSQETKKQILLDCLVMTGTNPAIMLVTELIDSRKIHGEEAIQLIAAIPTSIKSVSVPILRELIKLIERSAADVHKLHNEYSARQLWITTLLTTTKLVNQGCINRANKISNYPNTPEHNIKCSPNHAVITTRLMPYLEHELSNSYSPKWKKTVILQALSNLGHPYVARIVKPYIDGAISSDIHVRTKAVFALNKLAEVHPAKVFTILKPVFSNLNEHYEVRMAAFTVIMTTRPPASFWTEAAVSTWFEPSQQVGSFVYTTIANLANCTLPKYVNVSRTCKMALPLTKPFDLGIQYSHNYLISSFVQEKNLGGLLQVAWYGSEKSIIPRSGYLKLASTVGGFDTEILEVSLHAKGLQQLINKYLGPEMTIRDTDTMESAWDRISETVKKPATIERIQKMLNIKPRMDEPLQGSLSVKLFGQLERYFTFDFESIRDMVMQSLIPSALTSWTSSGFEAVFPINWQKAINLGGQMITIMPCEAGLPVFITVKRPALISIKGSISVKITPSGSGIPNIKVVKDIKPVILINNLVETGVFNPLNSETFSAGVNLHAMSSMPKHIVTELNVAEKQIKIEALPYSGKLPNTVEIFHLHQTPFVTRRHILDFTPITLAKETQTIRTRSELIENEAEVGHKLFGIPIVLKEKMDIPYLNFAGFMNTIKTYGLTSLELPAIPNTLRKMEWTVEVPVHRIAINKVEAIIKLFKSEKEYPVLSTECEKVLAEKFYEKRELEFNSESEKRVVRFYTNPIDFLRGCREVKSQCYDIYTAKMNEKSMMNRKEMSEEVLTKTESGKISAAHVKFTVFPKNAEPKVSRVTFNYMRSVAGVLQKLAVRGEFVPLVSHSEEPYRFHVSGRIQYPVLPATQSRQGLLEHRQLTKGDLEIRFGKSLQSAIFANLAMTRSESQREFAERSPSAVTCSNDESRGLRYSPACLRARKQATTINKYAISFTTQNTPTWLKNASYIVDDMVKYVLYPHMSNNRLNVENPSDEVLVVLDVHPPKPSKPFSVLDAFVYKPYENSFFKTIKVSPILDGVFPLNVKQSIAHEVVEKLFHDQFYPMCKVEHERIRTFDNVSYTYPMGECYHLVAKDCSEHSRVAVLAKESTHGKTLKIVIEDEVVLVKPVSSSESRLEVELNGKTLTLSLMEEKIVPFGKFQNLLEIKCRRDMEIEVIAPVHGLKVITSGERFKVQMSNMYRGRVCGLCGDMNGEKMAEFKTPRKCITTSPLAFGRSYAIEGESCSMPRSSELLNVDSVEKDVKCIEETIRPWGMIKSYRTSESIYVPSEFSSMNKRESEFVSTSSHQHQCTTYVTKVIKHQNKLCFSVKPLPECSLACKPTNTISKKIGFHCLDEDSLTMSLMAKARYGVVESMLDKPVHMMQLASTSESCERIEM
jgi:hypothetical protein